ncbi:S8 family peptidase [Paenibacillus thermoaerophilus]|uniref:S8 family peptidase n=1 Tax=Paenibacillus thermoaerophilus TaxID=1215385 RepID=A0ABW2UXK4_9BACL|nr:S8 family peptidase [Paenibacillus thermoaerophilus]
MKRWTFAGLIALAGVLALLLMPAAPDRGAPPAGDGSRPLSQRQEALSKEAHFQQDVEQTRQLGLIQGHAAIGFAADRFAKSPVRLPETRELEELVSNQTLLHHLVWISPDGQTVKAGSLPQELKNAIAPYVEQAKRELSAGRSYESAAVRDGQSESYVVIAEPASNGQGGLIGVVHHDILRSVEDHQMKNLRLVPFPSDKRYKIESVESGTLRDVQVQDGEDNQGVSHYKVDEVVVRFRNEPSEVEMEQIKKEIHSSSVQKLGLTYVFQSSSMDTKQMMDYFRNRNVAYVEPHYLYVTNDTIPNDSLFARYQWNLPIIGMTEGWDISRGAANVPVAVVDTGVNMTHPDLSAKLWRGTNIVAQNNVPEDDVGHGSHVAGVISALTNNSQGVAGMSWTNPIIPVKVLDSSGAGSTYAVAQGIIWATDNGARVINLSLGNYADAQFLHDAIKYAFDRDVVLVAAMGNDNTSRPSYPAAYPEVLAVGATDSNKARASFSNYGSHIGVTAPGVSIASTYLRGQYAALSGTSMASPHVAALAALIRSVNPSLRNTDVYEIIKQTAEDLGAPGKDNYFGYGQINVARALQAASETSGSLALEADRRDTDMRNRLGELLAP